MPFPTCTLASEVSLNGEKHLDRVSFWFIALARTFCTTLNDTDDSRRPLLVPSFNGRASCALVLNMLSDESFWEKLRHRMFALFCLFLTSEWSFVKCFRSVEMIPKKS